MFAVTMGGQSDKVSNNYSIDSREEVKQLTSEERKEIANKEGCRMGKLSSTVSTYSPRKERALKIYLDSSPKKHDDIDVD
uniref:Ubiquitin carboxyl-terminal hydrolase 47 C-terminal domain-containing protein n=1 Tax=Timema cristinae TaxID=61476 RepID=A0A7R9CI78_TIMCR|nr:unnamed protein product [Timema cristinae]